MSRSVAVMIVLMGCWVDDERADKWRDDPVDTSDDSPETGDDSVASPLDEDNDGWSEEDDCDDDDAAIHPGQEDDCDGADQDCDGAVDEDAEEQSWYADGDGDGYGSGVAQQDCAQPAGHVRSDGDCDDGDEQVSPEGLEVCGDGVDQDCSGAADEDWSECDPGSLGCTQSGGCFDATVRPSTCVCTCADGSMLLWEISGIIDDSGDSQLIGAVITIDTPTGTVGPLTCGDEILSTLPAHSGEVVSDVTFTFAIPCETALASASDSALGTWMENWDSGRVDRRSGSIVWLDLATGTEEYRWGFFEAEPVSYLPEPPCSAGDITYFQLYVPGIEIW